MSLTFDIEHIKGSFKMAFKASIPTKGITAIYGPSGSGKTSLLRCISGLDECSGEITFNAKQWLNKKHSLPPEARNIAYLFQEGLLFPHLNAHQNISFSNNATNESVYQLASKLGIKHRLNATPNTLSGGEKQRVCLCRALLSKPDLILMDEPLSAIDTESKKALLKHIHAVSSEFGIPIIYVSHSIREISSIADHLIRVESGMIVREGNIDLLLSQADFMFNSPEDRNVIMRVEVTRISKQWHLIDVALSNCPDIEITLALDKEVVDQKLRLQISAKDVSISLNRNADQSIANILPCTVTSVHPMKNPAHKLVELELGQQVLFAQVTSKSVEILKLEPRSQVWAQIKAVAVLD